MKILTKDVRVLSTGLVRKAGKSVGKSEVPPGLWQAWIDEGIVVDFDEDLLIKSPKPVVKSPKPAVEKDLEKGEVVEELPYSNLSLKRLRTLAEERGIDRYWMKKKATLVDELNK